MAKQSLPADVVDVLGYYAFDDTNPLSENPSRIGRDLVSDAINSVRGSAVDAMASLLFAHRDMVDRILPSLERAAHDPMRPIRAVTIHGLIALLNMDRDRAVQLFREICDDALIGASHHVADFIFYATYTHYNHLRPLLRRMLVGEDEEAKRTAAQQISLVSFRHTEAEEDLVAVLTGDIALRRAAAEIFAQNYFHPSVRKICENRLLRLLNDAEPEVRRTAENWLDHIPAIAVENDWDFFRHYLETEAFAQEPGLALHHLQKLSSVPEDVILRLADRAVELTKAESDASWPKAFRFASNTPTLVVRLYHQTPDETVRVRCLDLLDTMLGLGWNEAATEMAKAER
jgi:hypothetical protein